MCSDISSGACSNESVGSNCIAGSTTSDFTELTGNISIPLHVKYETEKQQSIGAHDHSTIVSITSPNWFNGVNHIA